MIDFKALFGEVGIICGGEGYTVSELEEKTGLGPDTIRKRLKKMLSEDTARVSMKIIPCISGRTMRVPAYVFKGDSW